MSDFNAKLAQFRVWVIMIATLVLVLALAFADERLKASDTLLKQRADELQAALEQLTAADARLKAANDAVLSACAGRLR